MTKEQLKMLSSLIGYQNIYEISIQFWPEGVTVYIAKDGIDLTSFGGDFDFSIGKSLRYIEGLVKKQKPINKLKISDIVYSNDKAH